MLSLIVMLLAAHLHCWLMVHALDNDPGRRPILGWNSWGWVQSEINHSLASAVLQQYVAAGLPALGYRYFNLDNGWQLNYKKGNSGSLNPGASSRDPKTKRLLADPAKFPNGMKAWCDEVHNAFRGAKCGIYTMTCLSEGHWDIDAQTFAEWGVDYVKMDVSCDSNPSSVSAVAPYFRNLSLAINRTGRVMDINACTGQGIYAAPELGPSFADSARIAMDAYQDANWRATIYNAGTLAGYAGPGSWLDMDMVGGMKQKLGSKWYAQDGTKLNLPVLQTALSIRAVFASPIVVSAWLNASGYDGQEEFLDAIRNPRLLAIHQDPLASAGWLLSSHEAPQEFVDLNRGQPHVRTLPCDPGAFAQMWEPVLVSGEGAERQTQRVSFANHDTGEGSVYMLRQNTTAAVYGYPAGTSLCLGLDLCQSHVTATPCNGSIPPKTDGHGACVGSSAQQHMHWKVAGQGTFVNVHSSLCLADFHKGTLGTAVCNDQDPSQQWARQPGGTTTTLQHPGSNRCLTMPAIDPSNVGQIFGRPLANGSLVLVFYNPAPAKLNLNPASDKMGRLSDDFSLENESTATGANNLSLCCDALCWKELSSGIVATGIANSISESFEIEDVWSGERNSTVVTLRTPFCVELGAAGESSRMYRLNPVA